MKYHSRRDKMFGRKRIRALERRIEYLEKQLMNLVDSEKQFEMFSEKPPARVNISTSSKLLRKDKNMVSISIERKTKNRAYYLLSISSELIERAGFKDWVYIIPRARGISINQNRKGEGRRLCHKKGRYFIRLSRLGHGKEYREGYFMAWLMNGSIEVDLESAMLNRYVPKEEVVLS